MPDASLLASTELFSTLPRDVVERLRDHATVRRLRRNDVIFRQGDDATELFVVQSGQIAIATRSVDGRESVVAVLESGELFGELPLFDGETRSTDARSLRASEVLAVSYDNVREVLHERPELLWSVVRLLARRLRATDEALADAVFLDVAGRTAKRLLELAGTADEFEMPLTQEELAGMVGASRERVNKALATFVRLSWIEAIDRGRYRITNRKALEQRSTM
jgi:CRP-like cAMP-binding protein